VNPQQHSGQNYKLRQKVADTSEIRRDSISYTRVCAQVWE